MKPEKFDSALSTVINGDSIYFVFLHGFNCTRVSLLIDNSIPEWHSISTSWITTVAYLKAISKSNRGITIEIDHRKHFLPIIKKFLLAEINYDSSSKTLKAEYSNDIPRFR